MQQVAEHPPASPDPPTAAIIWVCDPPLICEENNGESARTGVFWLILPPMESVSDSLSRNRHISILLELSLYGSSSSST